MPTMSLLIHRAERADRLSEGLGEVLSQPLDDPFAIEIVCVPTRGVERWLAQRLSHQLGTAVDSDDGVCAAVDFCSPRRLIARTLGNGIGTTAEDPWQPGRAVWPLLRVIEEARGESWLGLLWSYLGDRERGPGPAGEPDAKAQVRGDRRWSIARHLAGLFAAYGSSRPAMIHRWLSGDDVDGSGRPLPADRAWQAELWRRLRAEIGGPSPAERIRTAAAQLAESPAGTDLPSRLSLFGATRIDPDHLLVLRSLAHHRDVHLWLPHPSAALWERIATASADTTPALGSRAATPTAAAAEHRLLSYLGRDARELQLMLASPAEPTGSAQVLDIALPRTDPWPDHLLGWLQSDIAGNRPPAPIEERPVLRAADRSIELHASHGPDRQVEVLRELLVGLLADDRTLEPRDIVVMCPDIETYAPLIAASFGLDVKESEAEHPGHRLRVRLADRSLRQLNPLLSTVSRLVALADSRMEASAVLDFCSSPPVARKFSFSTDEIDRLHDLVPRSGVRWGLDAEHRSRYGMAQFAQNTWSAGLDRLLLGVAMDESEERFIGTALPMDDVDSSDVDLIGRLAECVDRIRTITDSFAVPKSLPAWCEDLKRAIELLTLVTPADSWQVAHAYAQISALAPAASDPGEQPVELGLAEVSALLADAFRGRASRANFRTGTLTICTMLPMRSVPHRVVCVLGVDDGVFPRHAQLDGDDILALDPWIGDRDPRSEDRQLLLDAIMAAQDHLLIIYAGLDPRTGARRPPAVPIGELLDCLDLTARTESGLPVRHVITTEHPLQPFDARNFVAPESGAGFSFDRASWRGALAARSPRSEPPATFGSRSLPPLELPSLELDDLLRFFNHPIRALLRDRAGLSLREEEEQSAEQIPIALSGLDRWAVGDRLLRRSLSGLDLERLVAAEWRRGRLPPRRLGDIALAEAADAVRELDAAAAPHLEGTAERRDIALQLDGQLLSGTVARLYGKHVVRVGFSLLTARQRLQAWIELLALTAAHPQVGWRAIVLGRGGQSFLGPVDGSWARLVLADLVELRRTGLCEPTPFAPKTSYEYARWRADDKTIEVFRAKLDEAWNNERDRAYEKFFGVRATLDDLMRQPSVAAEERGSLAEPSRFGTLARRVFHPLLSAEADQ
jgi:exodeoxyribonuclease V gamma subunit